jgi:hypothetical protein
MRRVLPVFALTALTLAVSPGISRAQSEADRGTARNMGVDAQRALEARDYKTAEDEFRRADELVHAPTLLLGRARALVGLGRFVDAQETYLRILREGVAPGSPPAFQRALEAAQQELNDVNPKVGAVTITVKGADGQPVANAKVTFDGVPVNAAAFGAKRPADPGKHSIHAAADGYTTVDLDVTVPTGGGAEAPITMQRAAGAATAGATPVAGAMPADNGPPPPPSDATASPGGGRSIWPWVAFGVGGAGLITGAITGVLAISKHSSLSGPCGSGTCPVSSNGDLDSYETLGTVSTIGFVVAGVGAAAGVTLLLLQPKSNPPPATGLHIVPVLGLGAVGAQGTF